MKIMGGLLAFFLSVALGWAQGVVSTLIPPTTAVPPGSTIKVDLMTVNPTLNDVEFEAPAVLNGTLSSEGRAWPIELRSDLPSNTVVRASGFSYRVYTLVLPADLIGRAILEAGSGKDLPMLRAVVVASVAQGGKPVPQASPVSLLGAATPAAAQLQRSFIGHFSTHEPIYFIYGTKTPAAKFQFSFKYRLLDFGGNAGSTAQRSVQFGYSQRSLWDIEGDSSPFYDTSYMPSLFFESLGSLPEKKSSFLTWIGFQSGFQHESNGRAASDSRSLNTLFARGGVLLGPLDSWHVIIAPKIWAYVGGLSDNANLKDYRGYGELQVVVGKNNGPALTYTGRSGRKFDHLTTQLDLTIPVKTKLLDFATYLLIQYFEGYGESLRDFDQRSETVRAGVSLVR